MREKVLTSILFYAATLMANAQSNAGLFGTDMEVGSYVLADNRLISYPAKIKLFAKELVAKDGQGKTVRYSPDEVYSIRIGSRRYTTAQGFRTKVGFGSRVQQEKVFVELLDSGAISIMRYAYTVGAPGMASSLTAYLLQEASQDTAVTIPVSAYTGKGKRFRDLLTPYLAKRSDLLTLLNDGAVGLDELPALIHALNVNQPFVRPKPISPFGVD